MPAARSSHQHPYPPALRRVLAELLAASALLASTLKLQGQPIVQLQGDGPVRLLVVECTADARPARHRAMGRRGARALPEDATLARSRAEPQTAASRSRSTRRTGHDLPGHRRARGRVGRGADRALSATSEQIASRLALAADDGAARAACCCSGCRAPDRTTTPPGGTRRPASMSARPTCCGASSVEALLAARFRTTTFA